MRVRIDSAQPLPDANYAFDHFQRESRAKKLLAYAISGRSECSPPFVHCSDG